MPLFITHNKRERRKVVIQGEKKNNNHKPEEVKKGVKKKEVISKEACGVSCVGCKLKDRDLDRGLIFKMNNKRGRTREADKREWR